MNDNQTPKHLVYFTKGATNDAFTDAGVHIFVGPEGLNEEVYANFGRLGEFETPEEAQLALMKEVKYLLGIKATPSSYRDNNLFPDIKVDRLPRDGSQPPFWVRQYGYEPVPVIAPDWFRNLFETGKLLGWNLRPIDVVEGSFTEAEDIPQLSSGE